MNRAAAISLLVLLAPLAACPADVPGLGAKDIELFAVADGSPQGIPPSHIAAPVRYFLQPGVPPEVTRRSVVAPLGTLTFEAAASLIDETGAEIPIAGQTVVQLRIETPDSARFAQRRVRPVEYLVLRLRFTRVDAFIEAGLIIDGIPRPGPLRIAIPVGASLVVDVPVELTVPQRARELIVVDLNASVWMPTIEFLTGTASPAAFAQAIRVRVR
jgi:hypothetical protein